MLSISSFPARSQTMEQVIAGAKKEGEVRIAITVRPKEGNIVAAPRLIEAFEKKYPFVKVRYTRVGGTRERERIFTELASGMVNYDVATLSQTAIPDGLRAKIFRKVDWKGLGIGPETANPDGLGVNYRTQLYGISYNTKLVSEEEARNFTWDSCIDPRWKGKFALDMRPRHLEILYQSNGWGREKTLDYARKLSENKPVLEVSRNEAQHKLVDGAYSFICAQFWSAHQEAASEGNANLGFVVPEPAVVNSGDIVFVPSGAKNSNAGILWILWSISKEGLTLLDQVQFTGDPMVPGTSAHPLIANKTVLRGTWESQINAQKTLGEILKTMGMPVAVE
jgi:iron(III) transport system substrate-binding protein